MPVLTLREIFFLRCVRSARQGHLLNSFVGIKWMNYYYYYIWVSGEGGRDESVVGVRCLSRRCAASESRGKAWMEAFFLLFFFGTV